MNTDNKNLPVNSEPCEDINDTQSKSSAKASRFSFFSDAYEAIKLDKNRIGNILQEGVQNAGQIADSVPIIGHAKGGLHYLFGNHESGLKAMKASSRTSGVILGGFLGFSTGGPIGGAIGGVVGGQMMDGAVTGIESAVHKEFRPNGSWTEFSKIAQGKLDQVDYTNLAVGAGLDAFLGYSFGNPSTLESLTNAARYTYATGSSLIARQAYIQQKYLYTKNLLKQSIPVMAILSQINREKPQEFNSLENRLQESQEKVQNHSLSHCKKLFGLTSAFLNYDFKDDLKHQICTSLGKLHGKGL